MSHRLTDAYVAGLIDGEGCIGVAEAHSGRKGYFAARVDIGMTTKARALLEMMKAQYGGTVSVHRAKTERWEAAERWTVMGSAAAEFLRRVSPFLRLKSEQAQIALKVEEIRAGLPMTPTGRARWTDEARARCAALKTRIHELNRKGPSTDHPQPMPAGARPIARLVAGEWVTNQSDLLSDLGWAPFSGTLPRSGMTRAGVLYELPMWAPRTGGTGSSSSPLLPTPVASTYGSNQSPSQHAAVRPSLEAIARDLGA